MRFENGVGAKGYHRSEIESAVRRYLDPSLPETTETTETELTPSLEFVSHVSPVSPSRYASSEVDVLLNEIDQIQKEFNKEIYGA